MSSEPNGFYLFSMQLNQHTHEFSIVVNQDMAYFNLAELIRFRFDNNIPLCNSFMMELPKKPNHEQIIAGSYKHICPGSAAECIRITLEGARQLFIAMFEIHVARQQFTEFYLAARRKLPKSINTTVCDWSFDSGLISRIFLVNLCGVDMAIRYIVFQDEVRFNEVDILKCCCCTTMRTPVTMQMMRDNGRIVTLSDGTKNHYISSKSLDVFVDAAFDSETKRAANALNKFLCKFSPPPFVPFVDDFHNFVFRVAGKQIKYISDKNAGFLFSLNDVVSAITGGTIQSAMQSISFESRVFFQNDLRIHKFRNVPTEPGVDEVVLPASGIFEAIANFSEYIVHDFLIEFVKSFRSFFGLQRIPSTVFVNDEWIVYKRQYDDCVRFKESDIVAYFLRSYGELGKFYLKTFPNKGGMDLVRINSKEERGVGTMITLEGVEAMGTVFEKNSEVVDMTLRSSLFDALKPFDRSTYSFIEHQRKMEEAEKTIAMNDSKRKLVEAQIELTKAQLELVNCNRPTQRRKTVDGKHTGAAAGKT